MKSGATSTSAYTVSTPDFYAAITIRVQDNAGRIEITAPTGMYSQKAYGVEYGFTPEMFNANAEVLIAGFEEHMKSESANDNW